MAETLQQRADAMRPRIRKLMDWLAWKYPNANWSRDSEEVLAAEALVTSRWLDYLNGGSDELVKEAILRWGQAHHDGRLPDHFSIHTLWEHPQLHGPAPVVTLGCGIDPRAHSGCRHSTE